MRNNWSGLVSSRSVQSQGVSPIVATNRKRRRMAGSPCALIERSSVSLMKDVGSHSALFQSPGTAMSSATRDLATITARRSSPTVRWISGTPVSRGSSRPAPFAIN